MDTNLINECQQNGISVFKRNGTLYSHNTLRKKLNMLGGAITSNPIATKIKVNEEFKKSPPKKEKQITENILLENPLGPKLDFHIDYNMKKGQAILEDPLIQAYFNRIGISKINDSSEIPVGLAMAIYGNHAQLGPSGLSSKLPNVLENPELKKLWDSKGIKKVTPQTMIPVKFLYLR